MPRPRCMAAARTGKRGLRYLETSPAIGTLRIRVGMPNLANGSQIEFELNTEGKYSATLVPTPLTILQHYYVVNCGANCGAFDLAGSRDP